MRKKLVPDFRQFSIPLFTAYMPVPPEHSLSPFQPDLKYVKLTEGQECCKGSGLTCCLYSQSSTTTREHMKKEPYFLEIFKAKTILENKAGKLVSDQVWEVTREILYEYSSTGQHSFHFICRTLFMTSSSSSSHLDFTKLKT